MCVKNKHIEIKHVISEFYESTPCAVELEIRTYFIDIFARYAARD